MLDHPRFVPPAWGPTPAPGAITSFPETSGFDVEHAAPDAYFFFPELAGGYAEFRKNVLQLTGPIPLLPDYAFGSWFLWYHNYSQSEKQKEVVEFATRGFPLDVAGIDMDWRNHPCYPYSLTPGCENYTHADEAQYLLNTDLWPDFEGFVDFIKGRNISVFFNDHPMKVNSSYVEMSPLEIQFRWDGLTSMLKKGLDFCATCALQTRRAEHTRFDSIAHSPRQRFR